jgi:outer membrane protein insertion porin family
MSRTILPLLALLLALSSPARGEAAADSAPAGADLPRVQPDAPKISAIKVEGNRRVDPDAIRGAMKSKVGGPFEPLQLQEDLKSLWKLAYFADVQILVDDAFPDRPMLTVKVLERPAVRSVQIRGNKELSDDDLKDIVEVKPFSILDMAVVQKSSKKLSDKYIEKGYYLAEVKPVVDKLDNNEVAVYFDVNEHAKVQVKRITFVGNFKIPDADLRAAMETDEGGFLSFLTSAGTFREEVFKRDLQGIQGVYYDRGFIHVKLGQPQIALSGDKRLIYVTIPVTEGEQYNIGKIDFSGDLLGPKEDLFKRLTVAPNELFNRSKLQHDIMNVADVYYDSGYAYANITPQTTVDADKRIVDLTFDVQKGEKCYIERIEISGNHKTRDKVIRRELRIYEGELFTGSGLRSSRSRVTALGFFETVDIAQRRGTADNQIVVTVSVKEKATGTFQVGLGFSSIESFLLTAQVSQNNLFGWGQTASLAAQISSLRSLVQVSYVDPYFWDTNWIFSFDYFRQDLDYFGFIRRSNGGDITWGYHITPDLMLHLGYAIEQVSVEPGRSSNLGGPDVLLANRFRNGLTSSLRLTVNWDQRDNRLFPTNGNFQSISIEHSPSWLGATFQFTRIMANTRWYRPIIWGIVFKAQGQLGYMLGDNIPISELFYAGGINTLRGFSLRSVAPTVRVGDGRSPDAPLIPFLVGGNKELLFNFELEFPIFEKVGIRGVVFYDAGNVYAQDETFFKPKGYSGPLGLLHSVGVGFRWFSPIGPLRFEWGFPLSRRPGDDSYLFEFTIGNFF